MSVLNWTESDFNAKGHSAAVVLYYAPWCGHCKSFKPIYAEFANKVKGAVVAQVDATDVKNKKLLVDEHVQGYPTVCLYVNGKKIIYNGGRTVDDLLQWCNTHSTQVVKMTHRRNKNKGGRRLHEMVRAIFNPRGVTKKHIKK